MAVSDQRQDLVAGTLQRIPCCRPARLCGIVAGHAPLVEFLHHIARASRQFLLPPPFATPAPHRCDIAAGPAVLLFADFASLRKQSLAGFRARIPRVLWRADVAVAFLRPSDRSVCHSAWQIGAAARPGQSLAHQADDRGSGHRLASMLRSEASPRDAMETAASLAARAIGCASRAPVGPISGGVRCRTARNTKPDDRDSPERQHLPIRPPVIAILGGSRSADTQPWVRSNTGVLRIVADTAVMSSHDRTEAQGHRFANRSSQRDGTTWDRIAKLADDWLPKPRVLHPWPGQRLRRQSTVAFRINCEAAKSDRRSWRTRVRRGRPSPHRWAKRFFQCLERRDSRE